MNGMNELQGMNLLNLANLTDEEFEDCNCEQDMNLQGNEDRKSCNMALKLDRDLLKEIAANCLSSPKLTKEFSWQNNEGFKFALVSHECQNSVISALRMFPILDFLGAYKCVYLSLCYDGIGLETPSASQTTIPMNVEHCVFIPVDIVMLKYLLRNVASFIKKFYIAFSAWKDQDGIGLETPSASQTTIPMNVEHCVFIPIDIVMLKYLLRNVASFIKKFHIAFSAWKDQVLQTLRHISLLGLHQVSCHVKAVRTEYGCYGKEISRILLENSNSLKRLDVARYFCDSIPYFDLDLEAMNITFSHYQNSRDGFDQLVAQNLRAKCLTLNTEWKNIGTNWIMFSDFFQNVTVEEIRLATTTFIYQKNNRKISPNPNVKRVFVQFESFFHLHLEEFFEEVAESFPNLALLYIMPDISDRHPLLNVDLCLLKVATLTENYQKTLEYYDSNTFQITIDIMGVFHVENKPLKDKLHRIPYGFERKELNDEEKAKKYRFSFGNEIQMEKNKTLISKVLIF
uniref:DUF38 domain-containing protein n=2 Tax=Acrobeloides nanus TaxID=290746 RepID=A0A914C8V2_9BILA